MHYPIKKAFNIERGCVHDFQSRKTRIDEAIAQLETGESIFLSLYPREKQWIEKLTGFDIERIANDVFNSSCSLFKITRK